MSPEIRMYTMYDISPYAKVRLMYICSYLFLRSCTIFGGSLVPWSDWKGFFVNIGSRTYVSMICMLQARLFYFLHTIFFIHLVVRRRDRTIGMFDDCIDIGYRTLEPMHSTVLGKVVP